MQYVQRKLQRSVTEIRRSWSGRPSVSASPPVSTAAGTVAKGTGPDARFIVANPSATLDSDRGRRPTLEAGRPELQVRHRNATIADGTAVPPAMTAGTSSGLHHTLHPPPQCGNALDPLQPRHLERHTTNGHDRREERLPASVELRPPERHDRSRRRADCRGG